MKAIVFLGKKKIGFIDIKKPEIQNGEALVKITDVAICGSDMSDFDRKLEKPVIVGHEAAGIVDDPGKTSFKKGDRVAILVVSGCGQCSFCQKGSFTLCEKTKIISPTNTEFVAVPEKNLISLPDDFSFEQGLLGFACGIGVALQAVNKLNIKKQDTAAVIGLGPIGLCAVEILKQKGVKVIGIDINDYRLNLAKKIGADIINPKDKIKDYSVDKVFIASGNENAALTGFKIVKKSGYIVLVGAPSLAKIDTFNQIIAKGITVYGSWHYGREDYQEIVDIIRNIKNYRNIVTHSFNISESQKAYDLFASGMCSKVTIHYV